MPFYAPSTTKGATLYDKRFGTLQFDFEQAPTTRDVYGYQKFAPNSITDSSIGRCMAPINDTQFLVVASLTQSNNFFVVDTSTTPWTLTYGASGTQNCQRIDNYNGVIGLNPSGYSYGGSGVPTVAVQYFDPITGTFLYNNRNNLPLVRYNSSVFTTAYGVYIVGGTTNTGLGYGGDANTIYKLTGGWTSGSDTSPNPGSWVSPWTAQTPPPVALNRPMGCVSIDGRYIHIVRSTNGSNSTSNVHYVYDSLLDSWTTGAHNETNISYAHPLPIYDDFFFGWNGTVGYIFNWVTGQESSINNLFGGASANATQCALFNNEALMIPYSGNSLAKLNPYQVWGINYGI